MLIGKDENGNRVHISKADPNNKDYFCPLCGERLIQKHGLIRREHFAHKENARLCDSWHYGVSDWHYAWVNMFPTYSQEVIIGNKDGKHLADVLMNHMVIEFQNTFLSEKEFRDRNAFFHKAGFKVIWIFNVRDKWDKTIVHQSSDNKYSWKHVPQIFDDLRYLNNNTEIYLDYSSEDDGIGKVIWISPFGMKYFCMDDEHTYTISSFVEKMKKEETPGRTLQEIWNSIDCTGMRCRNTVTGYLVQVTKSPAEQKEKYNGKVYGTGVDERTMHTYSNEGRQIRYADSPQWILEYSW